VQASLFATPGKGLAFQRRVSEGGASVQTAGPTVTTPVWLKLQRAGTMITAFYRKTTADEWTVIGQETLTTLTAAPLVGLALSSHVDGEVASATFSQFVIQN
jgi:hypothetical protein